MGGVGEGDVRGGAVGVCWVAVSGRGGLGVDIWGGGGAVSGSGVFAVG